MKGKYDEYHETDRHGIGMVLWLLPFIFFIHDGEELLTMPGWIAAHQHEIDQLARINETSAEIVRSLPKTTAHAAIAIGTILLLFVAVTAGVFYSIKQGFRLYAYAGLLGVLFLHVFTHVIQTIIIGGYTPGVVSSVVIIIPGSLYLYKRLFEAKLLTVKSAVISALIGFALFIPGVLLAQQIGQIISND